MRTVKEIRFDLRLSPHGWLTVHCTSEILPEEWADTLAPESLQQLHLLRDRLSRHQITEAELLRLGLLLGEALVPRSIQEPLARLIGSGPADDLLRLRIVTHDADLSGIAWEYVRLPNRYDDLGSAPVALDERLSVVRSPAQGPPVSAPTVRGSTDLRVLHASATDVAGFDVLRGDDHAIDLALWGGRGRRTRRVLVDRLSDPATRASLEDSLAANPDLLVFTGHSTIDDGRPALILADDEGRPDPISGVELAATLLRAGTPLVVLNACDTAAAGDASVSLAELLVRSGVRTVIGMQMPISDSNAGHFAVGMIGALGEGASVDAAVALGRRRVAERAGYAEWGIPTLITSSRAAEPDADLAEPSTRSTSSTDPGRRPLAATTRGGTPASGNRRNKALVAVAAVLVALIAAGGLAWATRSGDDPEEDVAGAVETAESEADEVEFHHGVFDAQPLNGSSLTDSSPELEALLDRFEQASAHPVVTNERGVNVPRDRKDWPALPAIGSYGSTNHLDNPECHRVLLTSTTAQGAAARIWTDGNEFVLVRVVQFIDDRTALQHYWANSLIFGLRPEQCSGWPASGTALDPKSLRIERTDFPLSGPASELMTSIGTEGTDMEFVDSAFVVLFRTGDLLVIAGTGALNDSVDLAAAQDTLTQVIDTVATR